MERIGIYGGTFNPPHIGHLQAARFAVEALGLSRLMLIPDRIAPHKVLPEGSPSPEQRLEMLRLAVGESWLLEVSDIELKRSGPSYTFETVEQLRQMHPEAELVLLMGTDMFLSFESWREPNRILRDASLAVLYRGQSRECESVCQCAERIRSKGAKVYIIDNPVLTVSSTDLRRMLVFGCAAPFLPTGIGAYIARKKLYGVGEDYHQLPMDKLEKTVSDLLKRERVPHVLGCRDTAMELARIWGVDETDAARAGMLHDVTKALDAPMQLTLCREYGMILDHFSEQNPKTLHALTGALVAEQIFGESPAVVEAIRWHTTGKANMSTLEKIVYIADYMEPNREFPGVERLRSLAFTDLNGALKLGLQMTVDMLRSQNRTVCPDTLEALAYLRDQ